MGGRLSSSRTRGVCEPVREAQDGVSASSEVSDTVAVDCVVQRIGGRKSHPGFHRVLSYAPSYITELVRCNTNGTRCVPAARPASAYQLLHVCLPSLLNPHCMAE